MQLDLFTPLSDCSAPAWSVVIFGRAVCYTLRRSERARRVWLKIDHDAGLTVSVPARMSLSELHDMLQKKASWITRNIKRAESAKRPPARPPLKDGALLPLLGKECTLKLRLRVGAAPSVKLVGGEIRVGMPDDRLSTLKKALDTWYREKAREVITKKVDAFKGDRRVGKVYIKDQKTRWGSCSSRGNLSFNWRLVMAPPEVVDYIVVHEITHLERLDHSKRFWEKVAKRCPDYKEHNAWLKKHGAGLSPW